VDRNLISWSVPNLISIWLMAAVGFLVVGLIAQFLSGDSSSDTAPANNS
jgi:hypothetical protein